MNKSIYIIIISLAITYSSYAQQGVLGDVKYSILAPAEFRQVNGTGWVLLDGGIDLQKTTGKTWQETDLFNLSGLEKLPDTRGVFIRGMNLERSSNSGDVLADRTVGSYQSDAFQGHKHFISLKYPAGNGNSLDWGNGAKRPTLTPNEGVTEAKKKDGSSYGKPKVSKETRPRNVVLYTYIKVNEN